MNRWVILTIVLVLIGGGAWIWRAKASQAAKVSPYRMGIVDRGTVETVVTATGTVSAVTTVQVGSQVSGTIKNLYVDFNSSVHKGEIVARLDPTFLQAAVNEAEANMQRSQASLTQADRDLVRTKDLFEKKLAAQSDFDNAQTAVDVAKANLAQTKAQLDRAKINLTYAVISSPTDGTVISRNVDVGQTVAASLQAPTLFTIAQDLREMQIEADIDEADIGGLKEGMDASFTVDAFPDETFHGTIKQIRYASATSQGVVTYPVMIAVSNPDLKLRPGMTANVSIITAQRDDVLRAPSVALRFRPANAPVGGTPATNATAQMGRDSTRARGQGRGSGQKRDTTGVHASGQEKLRKRSSTLWVKGPDGMPQTRQVSIGLNDGNRVEILSGELATGDSVIIGLANGSSSASGGSSANRMPGFGGGGMGGGGGRR